MLIFFWRNDEEARWQLLLEASASLFILKKIKRLVVAADTRAYFFLQTEWGTLAASLSNLCDLIALEKIKSLIIPSTRKKHIFFWSNNKARRQQS